MFYTYVLRSRHDDKLYIGYTHDLKQRVAEHSKGVVDATRGRRPLELVYYEACINEKKLFNAKNILRQDLGEDF